jgi:hypothetical protein
MAKASLISLEVNQLKYAFLMLKDVKNGYQRAVRSAIDTTLTEARSTFYDAINKNYALEKTKSREKEAIYVQRTEQQSLYGFLRYSSRTLPLINFKTSPNTVRTKGEMRKTISTEVRRGNKTKWRHSFIAKMKSGHVVIFERVGKVRYPITQLMANTSILQMIETMLGRDPELRSRIQLISERKLNQKINELLLQASK